MAYIYPAPGVASAQATLTLSVNANSGDTNSLPLPSLQDITLNNANDVFSWTTLDNGSKQQIATTSTNSLAMNLVVDQAKFFGTDYATATAAGAASSTAAEYGVFGLSKDKVKVDFSLYMGDEDDGTNGPTITGEAYVTGLAPTVSADSPVWVTPITLTVDGDYTATTA